MYIIYLDSLHPKNKKHKVNKVSFLHSQTTKRKSSGSAITSQGNRGRCRTKWFPCHHGRRPIAQINLNRKKKKKKENHFNFPLSLSFSRRRSLHPSFCALNFFLKFHRYTFPHRSLLLFRFHFSTSCLLLLRVSFFSPCFFSLRYLLLLLILILSLFLSVV